MIPESARFEVSPDVVATDFEGKDAVVLNLATKKYYTLNESATAIWAGIEQKRDLPGLVGLLLERFEVSEDRAKASVVETIAKLQAQQLVRPCPDAA